MDDLDDSTQPSRGSMRRGSASDMKPAIANEINGSPSLLNCVFTGNLAESGGAILNTFGSSPTLDDCHLEANEATGPFGGGGPFGRFWQPLIE